MTNASTCILLADDHALMRDGPRRVLERIDAFVHGERRASPVDRLSVRQCEILPLIAEGITTREIAERLRPEAKTVETHRTNIMNPLDLHDAVSLARFALRNGLVVESAPSELGSGPEIGRVLSH